jgi:hypothetical protein
MKTVEFEIKDSLGVFHTYEVDLFSVAENARLQIICARPLIRVLGKVGAVLRPAFAAIPEGMSASDLDIAAVVKIISSADIEAAADALLSIPEMLEEKQGPELVTRIFAGTRRLVEIPALQGQPTVGDQQVPTAIKQDLRDPSHQDAAFGDGNMAEYWHAAAMVLIVNFTQYGRKGSMPLSALLGKLTGGIFSLSPTSTETQPQNNAAKTAAVPPSD